MICKDPAQYPNRILVAVTGLTPQVVTETLFALCTQKRPFVPTEVHIITTTVGRDRLKHLLMEEGWYRKLSEEIGKELPKITDRTIHIIDGPGNKPFADVTESHQSDDIADDISRVIQKVTKDEDSAVCVSITGGRKTMGFYIGHALSLFGRLQDRLTHVIATAEFEHHNDFFFPTRKSNLIYSNGPSKEQLDTKDAKVNLIDIPFVRLRNGLPLELLSEDFVTYSMLIEAAQRNFNEPEVTLIVDRHQLLIDGHVIELSSQNFAWYYWMAKERSEHFHETGKGYIRYDQQDARDRFRRAYLNIESENSHGFDSAELSMSNDDRWQSFFREKSARIKRILRQELGVRAEPYCIDTQGKRPRTRNGLNIRPDRIHFKLAKDLPGIDIESQHIP